MSAALVSLSLWAWLLLPQHPAAAPDAVAARNLFDQAMAAQKAGKLAEAAKLLEQAGKRAPGNFAVWGNLGAMRAQLGDFDRALNAYQRALQLNPKAARLHLNIGIAFFRRGRFDESLASLDRFLATEPANAQARELRALALFQLARYEQSAEAYRELAAGGGGAEPSLAALYGWGQSLLKTGDRAGATAVFDKLFARYGSAPEAQLLEAQMLMAENRLDEALARLDRLAASAGTTSALRGVDLWRGITLEGLGRHQDARLAYEAEFKASGDLVAAYALGVLAGRDGDEKEALRWLDRAQPIDGSRYNVAYHRGRALLRLGRAADAARQLELSAARNPQSVPERYLLLQAYQKLGRGADARRLSETIRTLREAELEKDRRKVGQPPPPKN